MADQATHTPLYPYLLKMTSEIQTNRQRKGENNIDNGTRRPTNSTDKSKLDGVGARQRRSIKNMPWREIPLGYEHVTKINDWELKLSLGDIEL